MSALDNARADLERTAQTHPPLTAVLTYVALTTAPRALAVRPGSRKFREHFARQQAERGLPPLTRGELARALEWLHEHGTRAEGVRNAA